MKRIRFKKPPEIVVKSITQYWGDLGYRVIGTVDRAKFSAGLASGAWGLKSGWNCSRIKGIPWGEEYQRLYKAIKDYMDSNYLPLKSKHINERMESKTGMWSGAKVVVT